MATAEFLEAWRQATGNRYLLARIDVPRLAVTQTDTLYVSDSEVGSYPDTVAGGVGKLWQSVVKLFEDVRMPGAYGSTDVPLGNSGLQLLADRVVTFPAGVGAEIQSTVRESMATHLWDSARVTFYRYIHELGDFQHAQQFFKGDVIEVRLDGAMLTLSLQQRVDWNKPAGIEYVNSQMFPRAPSSTVGLPLPRQYGRLTMQGMRRPWTSEYGAGTREFKVLHPSRRSVQAVLVDTGRGGGVATNTKTRVAVAGHAVSSVAAESKGTGVWMDTDAGLALMDPAGTGYPSSSTVEVFNGTSLAGVKIPETNLYGLLRILPGEVINVANCAENPRNLLDPNDVRSVYFDYATFKRELHFTMQTPPKVGSSVGQAGLVIGYQSSATLVGFNGWASINGDPDIPMFGAGLVARTVPGVQIGSHVASSVVNGWYDYSGVVFKFYWSGGSPSGSVRIFFCGYVLNFRPLQDVVQSERIIGTRESPWPPRLHRLQARFGPFVVPVRTPPVTELRGKFFANLEGILDDVSGTYTGTPSALIERMPDIARHLLSTSGGQGSTQLDAASFNAARSPLVDHLGQALPHGMSIGEEVDVGTALGWLTTDALAQVRISPYDDKLKLHVWRQAQSTDYPWRFSRYDILEPLGPNCSRMPVSQMVTGVRVVYDYDARDRSHRSEATLAYNKSVAGYEYRNLRDEYMTVVAGVNDRLNWTRAAGARVCTLAVGDYDPSSLAHEVQSKMRTADSAGGYYWCAHVGTVTSNCNRIYVEISAQVKIANIPVGTWTMEQLAVQVAIALNAVSSGFSCSYSRATGKFTIANGTSCTIRWLGSGDVNKPYLAGALLGFSSDTTGTTHTSSFAVEEGRFAIVASTNALFPTPIDLNFQSGPDGTDSAVSVRHCADVLGFDPAEDKLAVFNTIGAWTSDCPKGNREQIMKRVADRFKDGLLRGARRELAHQARTIYNTRTARALRNRIADLFSRPEPHTIVRFTTYHAPDIEIGNVFEFQADLDELAACPVLGSGGSWVGQGFVVTEYAHRNGPTSRATEIVGVEVAVSLYSGSWGEGWGENWGIAS